MLNDETLVMIYNLRREIDLISQLIIEKISLDDVSFLSDIIENRLCLIKRLCSMCQPYPDYLTELNTYIFQVQQGDQSIVAALQQGRIDTEKQVKNINHILSYTAL
jgi:hypothetical protein